VRARHNKRSQTKGDKESPITQREKRRLGFSERQTNFRAITEEVDGKQVRRLRGYPILFDVLGEPWRGSVWKEKISRNALDGVDFSKLVMLLDHKTEWVLGKVGKNMTTEVDDTGLFVDVTLGDTWLDDYVFDRVQRELMDGMSFWFDRNALVASDWEAKIDTIVKINEVYEVSVLTFPAYEDTAIIAEAGEESRGMDGDPVEPMDDEAKKQALMKLIELL
jgi:HK97 family phage prohead protease